MRACMQERKVSVLFTRRIWFLLSQYVVSIHIYEVFISLCFFFRKQKLDLWLLKMKSGNYTQSKWERKHTHTRTHTSFLPGDASIIIHFVDFQLSVSLFIFPFGFFFLSLSRLLLIVWQPQSKFISISLLNTDVRWVFFLWEFNARRTNLPFYLSFSVEINTIF